MNMPPGTKPFCVKDAIDEGVRLHKAGQLEDAQSLYDHVLEQMQHPVAFSMRGLIAHQQGDNTLAVTLISRAVAMDPDNAVAHCNLGSVLMAQERFDEAVAHLETAVRLNPDFIGAQFNLGNAYVAAKRTKDAIAPYERALALQPDHQGAMMNLAAAQDELGQYNAAVALLRRITALDPQHAQAFNNLGAILGRAGLWSDAIGYYERAIAIRPDYAEALNNLGALYLDMGNKEKARECFNRAPQLQPRFHEAASNRLFLMHYEDEWSQEQLLVEAKAWASQHAPASLRLPPAATPKDPDRRLRIGYVSADLRSHPVGFFMESVLAQHHASGDYDIICYSDTTKKDDTSRRMRKHHTWRDIHGSGDESVARLIREDGIDILIDLAGHTAHNRLTLFGRKPAPVQMTYLGYFDTTGLETMDYILCDAQVLPPQIERYFTEKPLRLPECYLCYTPPAFDVEVKAPPALANGFVTFGCFY